MPNCKRCGSEFKAELPDWQTVAVCDLCHVDLLSYFVEAPSLKSTNARIKATKRLYGRDAEQAEVEVLPCEVDFTPQEAPAYDAPTHIDPMYEAVAQGEREARARALARPGSLGFDG